MGDAESILGEVFPVPEWVRKQAYIKSRDEYEKIWKRSIEKTRMILSRLL